MELLVDAYGRVAEEVAAVLDGASPELLAYRPDRAANTVAWLVWHLTRVQDDHVSDVAGTEQVWTAAGWVERFALPFGVRATGYGHSAAEVGSVRADADLLRGYFEDTHAATMTFLESVTADDLDRVVDVAWDPPVTLGVRLVSVLADDLQHVGQAAYVRGLARRAGL